MSKWRIIARHEYLTNIKRKEFLFVTFGIPLFLMAIMGISVISMGTGGNNEVNKIGYVDMTGLFDSSNLTKYNDEELARKDLLDNKLTNYFVIPENYTAAGKIIIYSSKKNFANNMKIEDQVKNFLLDNLLKNEPSDIIERIKRPIDSEYFTLNENGLKSEDGGFMILLLPLFFSMLFSLSIFASSGFLLQSVIEEKENRIMEIILSSVSHKDLLTGKIIGLGALGSYPGNDLFNRRCGDNVNQSISSLSYCYTDPHFHSITDSRNYLFCTGLHSVCEHYGRRWGCSNNIQGGPTDRGHIFISRSIPTNVFRSHNHGPEWIIFKVSLVFFP